MIDRTSKNITEKQRVFVDEYLIDLNATQAAVRAGYSVQTANKIGSQLLGKTRLQSAIAAAQAQRAERTAIAADRVLLELQRIAFFDIRRILNGDGSIKAVDEWDDAAVAAVSSFEVFEEFEGRGDGRKQTGITKKLKLHSKVTALINLGQHLGLFKTKVELTGKDGGHVETSTSPLEAILQQVADSECLIGSKCSAQQMNG
jgi:phage terminase small subunit